MCNIYEHRLHIKKSNFVSLRYATAQNVSRTKLEWPKHAAMPKK